MGRRWRGGGGGRDAPIARLWRRAGVIALGWAPAGICCIPWGGLLVVDELDFR